MAVHIDRLTSTVRLADSGMLSEQQLEQLVQLVAARLQADGGHGRHSGPDEGALYRSALPELKVE